MKFKKSLLILIFTIFLCSIISVSAVDINDTAITTDDEQPLQETDENILSDTNDIAVNSFTALEVKIAFTPEGGTLELDKDYEFNTNSNITTGVFINKNITIDGKGHSIDGKSKSRIFNINYGNNVVLKNIVFKNGFAKIYGGAILSFANLTVDKCTFTNNYAHTAGGAINSLGGLTLTNSKFNKNVADGDAGAVFSLSIHKSADIYRAYFEGRDASEDSNLLLTLLQVVTMPSTDTISNCVFTNNVANGRGGGAVYAYTNININSCTFTSNKAGEKGAAVFGCKDLYIKNSKFTKNSVGMYGGAVYFKCHETSGSYDANGNWVSSYVFYNNLIQGCTFTKNVAGERGGAIYGFKLSSSDKTHCAKAVKCTFEGNKAPNGRDVYGGTTSKCTFNYLKLTLKSVTIKKSAKKLVLTATLKKGKTPIKAKKITFKFNGKTYKAKTNKKGIAKVTIKKNVLKKLKVGKKVKYIAKYSSLSVKKTAKVKK